MPQYTKASIVEQSNLSLGSASMHDLLRLVRRDVGYGRGVLRLYRIPYRISRDKKC